MTSRSRLLISLPCLEQDKPGSLTAGKKPTIEVSVDHSTYPSRRYCVNARVYIEDPGRCLVGGWEGSLQLEQAARFSQKRLDSLKPSNEQVLTAVNESLTRSGLALNSIGAERLKKHLSHNTQ